MSQWYKKFVHFIVSLKQLEATRITEKPSTLLDHILRNSKKPISQWDIMGIGLSDHQMVYYTSSAKRKDKYE